LRIFKQNADYRNSCPSPALGDPDRNVSHRLVCEPHLLVGRTGGEPILVGRMLAVGFLVQGGVLPGHGNRGALLYDAAERPTRSLVGNMGPRASRACACCSIAKNPSNTIPAEKSLRRSASSTSRRRQNRGQERYRPAANLKRQKDFSSNYIQANSATNSPYGPRGPGVG